MNVTHSGSFHNLDRWMSRVSNIDPLDILHKYGREGVTRLSMATPYYTGQTASSWNYAIDRTSQGYSIQWFNTERSEGVPVVILLQYGHATRNGGYVQGIDFINEPTRRIFEKMAQELWKEVRP